MVFGCICNINERVESNVPAVNSVQQLQHDCSLTAFVSPEMEVHHI